MYLFPKLTIISGIAGKRMAGSKIKLSMSFIALDQILEPNVDYNKNSYYMNSKYVWINIMRMVITSKVKDVNLWLSYREERLLTISKFATNIWEYVETGGSNVTAITFDVIDEKQMYLALNDEMVKSEMLRHGVLPETILSFKQKL